MVHLEVRQSQDDAVMMLCSILWCGFDWARFNIPLDTF